MLKYLFKKESQVETLLYDYIEAFKKTQENFINALNSCLLNGYLCQDFDFYIRQTHKYESKADDIREEINNLMYGKALIPESRGDVMELLEAIDSIPHIFEQTLYMIQIQKIITPEFVIDDLRELVRISLECCDLMLQQVAALLEKQTDIRSLMRKIDTNESHCDHYERKIKTKIFNSDIDPFERLQLKELVEEIGNISDKADRVSKLINIFSLKRRV